jgi:GNAT superfamily N-acetyltransferase
MSSATTLTRGHSRAATQAASWRLPQDAVRLATYLALRDGVTVGIRAIRADDIGRLHAFHAHLSPETIYWRFFTLLPALSPQMAGRLTHVDYEHRMALVATTGDGDDERIVAVVRYERAGPTVAEAAFVVADEWQRQGIATALLHRLAAYARKRGIVELVALTMAGNTGMHRLLQHCGFPVRSSHTDGLIEMRLDISSPPITAVAVKESIL